MPSTSSTSSFIPKNNLPKRKKAGRRYNLFFVNIMVFGLFLASPIASAAVFIYEKHTTRVINQTTQNLDAAIKSFSESELLAVTQFNNRLTASTEVLQNAVPVNSLIEFFLQNAPRTVSFTEIEIESMNDGTATVIASVESESFDSVLFYRDEVLKNTALATSTISSVSYQQAAGAEDGTTDATAGQASKLSYQITFTMPVAFFMTEENTENDNENIPEEVEADTVEEVEEVEEAEEVEETEETEEIFTEDGNDNNQ